MDDTDIADVEFPEDDEEEDEMDFDSDEEEDEMDFDSDEEEDEMDFDSDEEEEDEMDFDSDEEEDEMDDEDVTIDLTNEPIENVLKVFSRMKDTDEISVVEDGDGNIHLSDDETNKEYYIVREGYGEYDEEMYDPEIDEMYDSMDEEMDEYMMEMDDEGLGMYEEDDIMYEIEMDTEMLEMDDSEMEEGWSWGGAAKGAIMGGLGLSEEEPDEYMMESKKTTKPKGMGIGNGPKFNYGKVMDFPTKKMKKGDDAPYKGKGPKYDFDKNSPSLKGEFKDGKYGMNKGDKSKTHKGDKDYTFKKGTMSKTHKGKDFEEMKEASRTYGAGSKSGRGLRKGITPNRNLTFESVDTNEIEILRQKNDEYRKALNVFRNKLNEVAVFNSNLAYATRLFTEHSTSKQEKLNILKRFDGVETLKESKNLYKSIKDGLGSSKSQAITESIETKIDKTPSNGSAINLIESKTYENPQFLRMKDLMSKLK